MPKIVSSSIEMITTNATNRSTFSLQEAHETQSKATEDSKTRLDSITPTDFSDKISYAFQLATAQGPMCHEPMQGVAVFLEEVTVATSSDEDSSARDQLGRLTGEVIKTVRDSIRQGFMDWSPRLMLAMYSCEIQASSKPLPSPFLPTSSFILLFNKQLTFPFPTPQPKSSAASTQPSPAAAATSSPNPSRKARPSTASSRSCPSPNRSASRTRSASARPVPLNRSSCSRGLKFWTRIRFGCRRRKRSWRILGRKVRSSNLS